MIVNFTVFTKKILAFRAYHDSKNNHMVVITKSKKMRKKTYGSHRMPDFWQHAFLPLHHIENMNNRTLTPTSTSISIYTYMYIYITVHHDIAFRETKYSRARSKRLILIEIMHETSISTCARDQPPLHPQSPSIPSSLLLVRLSPAIPDTPSKVFDSLPA